MQPVIGCLLMEGALDGTGERILTVTAENPSRSPGFEPSGEAPKERLELFHILAFCADYALAHGVQPYESLRPGGDPPDFEAHADDALIRVDCVAFADTHRRRSYKLMDSLRERAIASVASRDFSGVAGCAISVWFGPTMTDLPPKTTDDKLVDPLLDAIEACKVDFDATASLSAQIATEGFPQVMPPLIQTGQVEIDGDGAGFVVNVVAGRDAVFPSGLPFDLQLSRQADLSATAVVEQLQRLVTSHDKGSIDSLVVTAGGPDRSGRIFPAEEAAAVFLLGLENVAVTATHIKSVNLHLWSGRAVAEVSVRAPLSSE